MDAAGETWRCLSSLIPCVPDSTANFPRSADHELLQFWPSAALMHTLALLLSLSAVIFLSSCRTTAQANNKRNNRRVEAFGRTRTVANFCRESKILPGVVYGRLDRGWSPERALTTPVGIQRGKIFLKAFGRVGTVADHCREFSIAPDTVRGRLRLGWSPEKALTTPSRSAPAQHPGSSNEPPHAHPTGGHAMIAARKLLPHRRHHEVRNLDLNGIRFTIGIGRFPDGALAEVFIDAGKAGSSIDGVARDGAILVSLLLQHRVPLAAIRHSITRNPNGTAASPLGAIIDLLAREEGNRS
jgi:ribonucleoside-diphosphate reductase alpha chain